MRASSDPTVKAERDKIILKPGMKAGKLTLIEKIGSGWKCKCDCGNEYICTKAYRLKNEIIGDVRDHTGSCGCIQRKTTNLGNKANRKGSIDGPRKEYTEGGSKILWETPYRDNIRSIVVMAECQECGQPYPTLRRYKDKTCGNCYKGNPKKSLEDFVLENHYKSIDEIKISELLENNNIKFEYEKTFHDLIDKARLPFDFFVNKKYIIEFDGEQHFHEIGFFNFEKIHLHDIMKNRYCFNNNIPLIRIPYDVKYDINDLKLETTRFLLTPINEEKYYESRS